MANNTSDLAAGHLNDIKLLAPFILIGVLVSAFNIFTISIILSSKKLRRPFNYPTISVLLGATLQSLLTTPAYALKQLDERIPHYPEPWICDLARFPYLLCGHILKISFMAVSFDRLFAVKYPYQYKSFIKKRRYIISIILTWVIVIFIDTLPFFPNDGSKITKMKDAHMFQVMCGELPLFLLSMFVHSFLLHSIILLFGK